MTILLVVIFLSLIVLLHEFGHFLVAKLCGIRVDEFGFGFPPRIWGRTVGETTYSLNALPFGGFVRIHGLEPGEEGDTANAAPDEAARSFEHRPTWQRGASLLAGVAMNIILGWLVLVVVYTVGSPSHLMLSDISAGSPAERAGLRAGDVVLQARFGRTELSDPISSHSFSDFVKTSAGETLVLTVERGSHTSDIAIVGRTNPPEGQGPLGVALADAGYPAESLWQSLGTATVITGQTLWFVIQGFWQLIAGLFVAPVTTLQQVAGPVGIFSLAAQVGAFGIVPLLQLMAFLSLNVAILNLVPFPALDGGRFLLLLIERFWRPVPERWQAYLNRAGFALLIALMILVTLQDVGKIVSGSV